MIKNIPAVKKKFLRIYDCRDYREPAVNNNNNKRKNLAVQNNAQVKKKNVLRRVTGTWTHRNPNHT